MRGRPPKPLNVKKAEGSRLRKDRLNTDAPEPPRGPMDPPSTLSAAEVIVWTHLLANQASGVFRPVDTGAMRDYCWFVVKIAEAQRELREWETAPKKQGETRFLRKARNGSLVVHQLFRLVNDLRDQVTKLESVLGLTPVARERIRASVQRELFGDDSKDDGWASYQAPSDKTELN